MKKAIIIGSGIGGIALSIRLAQMGYLVKVFESNSYPGGKIHSIEKEGFRFDAGPSLFTMPDYVDELFKLCDENPRDYFNYKRKKIGCKYFWEDGTELIAYGDKKSFLNEVEKKLNIPKKILTQYFKKAKVKYDSTSPLFLNKSLHKIKTYLSKEALKAVLSSYKYDIFKSLHQVNQEQLKEPHLVQLFDRFATYIGSDPFQVSGMMSLIQHLEKHFGTYVPLKGMISITESLFHLSKRQGVEFIFNSKVDRIIVEKNNSKGIKSNGKFHQSDIVISNMDINPTYNILMQDFLKQKKIINNKPSSSALIFYWGISKNFPNLDLHNIFFSKNYNEEFEQIFEYYNISNDPTVYLNITSKDVKGDAPMGCENWFVMINSPYNNGQDWDLIVSRVRKNVIKKLSKILKTDISKNIVAEEIMTPVDIQNKTSSHLGSLYGPSSNNLLSAFFRHSNFSSDIKNLFFCGGSVHPGGGIPICLLSAKITAELINKINK